MTAAVRVPKTHTHVYNLPHSGFADGEGRKLHYRGTFNLWYLQIPGILDNMEIRNSDSDSEWVLV